MAPVCGWERPLTVKCERALWEGDRLGAGSPARPPALGSRWSLSPGEAPQLLAAVSPPPRAGPPAGKLPSSLRSQQVGALTTSSPKSFPGPPSRR